MYEEARKKQMQKIKDEKDIEEDRRSKSGTGTPARRKSHTPTNMTNRRPRPLKKAVSTNRMYDNSPSRNRSSSSHRSNSKDRSHAVPVSPIKTYDSGSSSTRRNSGKGREGLRDQNRSANANGSRESPRSTSRSKSPNSTKATTMKITPIITRRKEEEKRKAERGDYQIDFYENGRSSTFNTASPTALSLTPRRSSIATSTLYQSANSVLGPGTKLDKPRRNSSAKSSGDVRGISLDGASAKRNFTEASSPVSARARFMSRESTGTTGSDNPLMQIVVPREQVSLEPSGHVQFTAITLQDYPLIVLEDEDGDVELTLDWLPEDEMMIELSKFMGKPTTFPIEQYEELREAQGRKIAKKFTSLEQDEIRELLDTGQAFLFRLDPEEFDDSDDEDELPFNPYEEAEFMRLRKFLEEVNPGLLEHLKEVVNLGVVEPEDFALLRITVNHLIAVGIRTLLARQVIAKSGGNNAVSQTRINLKGPATRKSQLKKLGLDLGRRLTCND